MRRIQVYVVLPPRLTLLDIAGPMEVLRRANVEQTDVRFDVRYIGASATIMTSIGIPVSSIEPLPATLPDDAMVVLAGDVDDVMTSAGVTDAGGSKIDSAHYAAIVKWLREAIRPGHKVISICSVRSLQPSRNSGWTLLPPHHACWRSLQYHRRRKF